MHRLLFIFLGFVLATGAALADNEGRQSLVVVASEASPMETLSAGELRRVFLLLPIEVSGIRPIPLRNESDEFLSQVFLQRVIFMSQSGYERQLVSRVFRFGGTRPHEFDELDELVEALLATPQAVSVMWAEQQQETEGLKVLGVVWESSTR